MGCSPWGREQSDTTERLHFHFSLSCIGEGNGNPLQCSCLENPRDGIAWWAAVYGVAQSRTRLKRHIRSTSTCSVWLQYISRQFRKLAGYNSTSSIITGCAFSYLKMSAPVYSYSQDQIITAQRSTSQKKCQLGVLILFLDKLGKCFAMIFLCSRIKVYSFFHKPGSFPRMEAEIDFYS